MADSICGAVTRNLRPTGTGLMPYDWSSAVSAKSVSEPWVVSATVLPTRSLTELTPWLPHSCRLYVPAARATNWSFSPLRMAAAEPSATPPPIWALPLSSADVRLAGVTWTSLTLSPYFLKIAVRDPDVQVGELRAGRGVGDGQVGQRAGAAAEAAAVDPPEPAELGAAAAAARGERRC